MKTSFWLALILTLTACGASKSGPSGGQDELLSRNGDTMLNGKNAAKCNMINISAANLEGVLSAYWDPSKNAYDYDRIALKVTRVPGVLLSNSTVSMRIVRFGYDGMNLDQNSSSTPIRILLNSTGAVVNTNSPLVELSQGTINSVISSGGLASHGVTLANFFSKVTILIDDVHIDYDALTFNFFDSSRGTAPYASGSTLIPAFHANPNSYAKMNPASQLQVLHPHFNNKDSGWTDDVFASFFESLCSI